MKARKVDNISEGGNQQGGQGNQGRQARSSFSPGGDRKEVRLGYCEFRRL